MAEIKGEGGGMTEEKALELEKLHKAIDLIHEAQDSLEKVENQVQEEINLCCKMATKAKLIVGVEE